MRALTERQKLHLRLAAQGHFSLNVERTCPSLERRGFVEKYWHHEGGRRYRMWRITGAGLLEAARLAESEAKPRIRP